MNHHYMDNRKKDSEPMSIKPRCPICEKINIVLEYQDAKQKIFRCPSCACDFTVLRSHSGQSTLFGDAWKSGFKKIEKEGNDNFGNSSPQSTILENVLKSYGRGEGRSLLHINCGYGALLKEARDNGWNCFGVSYSSDFRQKARERYQNSLFIVASIDDMVPHEFDLILMSDVIEYFGNPCTDIFYKLFSIGAIAPHTEIIIATPNARTKEFLTTDKHQYFSNLLGWQTRYSGEAIIKLLEKLLFNSISVHGVEPCGDSQSKAPLPDGENTLVNIDLIPYGTLICRASGSTFKTFMQERYIPGTWSNLTKYEHLPRYLFAVAVLTKYVPEDANVLDFGCGVGYGTRMLAAKSSHATGLDIDSKALEWARTYYGEDNIEYIHSETLGDELPANSFDLITCLEVIEHVDQLTQRKLLTSLKRLIKDNGMVVLSTPNPAITAQYGQNEFHVHEMERDEFKELLEEEFDAVIILEQYMSSSVTISRDGIPRYPAVSTADFNGIEHTAPPVAYIAVCSNKPFKNDLDFSYMDFESDLVRTELYQRDRYYKVLGEIFDFKNRA